MQQSRLVVDNSEQLEFRSSLLSDVLALWRGKIGDRVLPARDDFDPLEIPARILPHIALIDVLADATINFRYRLIGTHISETLGYDATGKTVGALLSQDNYDDFMAGYLWVVANRRPMRSNGSAVFVNKAWLTYESVILPLSRDNSTVNMLMIPTIFTQASEPEVT
jgi:hypothetical protein